MSQQKQNCSKQNRANSTSSAQNKGANAKRSQKSNKTSNND